MNDKYCFTIEGHEQWNGSEDSIESAKEECISYHNLEAGDKYRVGRCVQWHPHIDADVVLEQLECEACDEVGEPAEEWLAFVPKEEREVLEKRLNEVFQEWMRETSNAPYFYTVIDEKEFVV